MSSMISKTFTYPLLIQILSPSTQDEIGVYYEIESIRPHIVSLGAEDEQYDK